MSFNDLYALGTQFGVCGRFSLYEATRYEDRIRFIVKILRKVEEGSEQVDKVGNPTQPEPHLTIKLTLTLTNPN